MSKQTIAAGLLALSFAVQAADVAHMPNQNGGLIVLTDEPCRNHDLPEGSRRSAFHAYATGYSGIPMYGCYTVLTHSINMLWHEPVSVHRVYPADAFVITGRRANRNQGSTL